MKKTASWAVGLFLLLLPLCAAAITAQSTTELLQSSMSTALDAISNDIQKFAVLWLGGFIAIQFVFTNIGLLSSGAEFGTVWAKFLGALFWAGICIYVYDNGQDFLKSISNFFISHASGSAGTKFDPSYPIQIGLSSASSMLDAMDGAKGGILSSLNPFPSIMMGLVSLVILATCAIVAFKILMLFIETKIVIALAPLSFALLGLTALRDQGFAPFKYLISMGYRMLIYAAILIAMTSLSQSIVGAFSALPASSDPSFWPPIWTAAIGYSLLGGLSLRADSIAAMLSSGNSQMSTGDAAAVSATSAAAGGVVGGALAAAAPTAASAVESIGEFMRKQGGSIKDASSFGFGGKEPIGAPPVRSSSLYDGSGPVSRLAQPGTEASPGGGKAGGSRDPSAAPQKIDLMVADGSASNFAAAKEVSSHSGEIEESSIPSATGSPSLAPEKPGGNASTAGISGSGNNNDLEKKIDSLTNTLTEPKKPTLKDHLGEVHRRAEQDRNPVQVSLNTHSENF